MVVLGGGAEEEEKWEKNMLYSPEHSPFYYSSSLPVRIQVLSKFLMEEKCSVAATAPSRNWSGTGSQQVVCHVTGFYGH